MKKASAVLLNLLVFPAVLLADSEMAYKALMITEPAHTWTSGLKQRSEVKLPMVGQQISITRVDKGVIWKLNPKKKTYTEEPIALPYTKQEPAKKEPESTERPRPQDPNETKCTAELTSLSATRTIGGLTSKGFSMACKESPGEATIIWISDPSAVADAAKKDQETYAKAYTKALFANYPAKERDEMVKGASALSGLLSQMPRMLGEGKLPKGMWTALEMESKEDGKQSWYELVKLSAAPIKGDLFEVPAGYTKMAAGGLSMDTSEMMEEMKKGGLDSLMKSFGGK